MQEMVITGINLFEGGPLSIYRDCLNAIIKNKVFDNYQIVAFVHRKELFKDFDDSKIVFIQLPDSRKNYIKRLYYEFIYFYNYSNNHDVKIWLSLHDITPRVNAERVFTYCHNVSPFLKGSIMNIKYGFANALFPYFYKYVYRINIKRATALIVQTDWMRKAFLEMYPINNIIVARPNLINGYVTEQGLKRNHKKIFIYPVYPRYFKNFEIICEAARQLDANSCEILLTVDGSENTYSKELYEKYKDIKCLKWIGTQTREAVYHLYDKADCLLFSSDIETWGLPISEFKVTGKDMILVDISYARETLGEYTKVMFFKKNSIDDLRRCMVMVIENKQKYTPVKKMTIAPPYAGNWDELISLIV